MEFARKTAPPAPYRGRSHTEVRTATAAFSFGCLPSTIIIQQQQRAASITLIISSLSAAFTKHQHQNMLRGACSDTPGPAQPSPAQTLHPHRPPGAKGHGTEGMEIKRKNKADATASATTNRATSGTSCRPTTLTHTHTQTLRIEHPAEGRQRPK